MTKSEYINKLEKALADCKPDFRAEITADYEEHFRNGLQEGKSEDEICKQLGDIEEFIKEIPEDCYISATDCSSDTASDVTDNPRIPAPDPSTQENQVLPHPATPKSNTNTINKIIVHGNSIDVEVIRSSSDNILIDCDGDYNIPNPPYIIEYPDDQTCELHLQPQISKTFFGIFSINVSGSVTLSIPSTVQTVEINGSSGDICMTDLQIETIELHTASGDIDLNHIQSSVISAGTASGDIDLSTITVTTLKLSTASGDINLKHIQAQTAALSTASGDIGSSSSCIHTLNAETSSGDIDITNDMDGTISLSSSSGNIEYHVTTGNGYLAEVHTRSGDCEMYFEKKELYPMNGQNAFCCGKRTSIINASSVSGDIEING